MILPIILVFIVNAIYPLSGKEGFAVLGCMVVNVLVAWVLYKKGIIKMIPKEKASKEEKAE